MTLMSGPRGSAHARLQSKRASISVLCGCGATSPQLTRMGLGQGRNPGRGDFFARATGA
jgi:hypothetical protein